MAVLADLSTGIRAGQTGRFAILGARLVDGTGKPAVADSAVVVENGRIVAAGPRASVKVPKDAAIFDAKGKTLLPGLWDMHAHFEQAEWGPIYLAAGVTTVRDVGNELEFIEAVRDAVKSGRGLGPQLLLAGIVDGSGPFAIGGVERVDSAADAKHWVSEYKKHGFDQMKIYSSVTLENVKAICDEAHKAGMTCTGHIPNGLNIYQGVQAGMTSIGLGGGGGRGGGPVLPTSAKLTDPDVLVSDTATVAGGYWPSYLFADGEVGQKIGSVSIPMGGRGSGGGGGGRAHAANEFYTVESIGKTGGLANAEKNAAAAIYQYAQLTTVPPKPKATPAK